MYYSFNKFVYMKVLIIEDNDILRGNIKKYLEIQGAQVEDHDDFKNAVSKIMTWNFDVIILDLWLGSWEWDGIDVCKEVRKKGNNVPILMLTARTLTPQKIEWLNSWADDYVSKPFDYAELYARLQSISRRNDSIKWETLIVGDLEINLTENTVVKNNIEVSLSKLEFNLLVYLARNKWRTLTKEDITEKVWWEIDLFKVSRTVDIYIWYLRKKLWTWLVETVRGVWYIIK